PAPHPGPGAGRPTAPGGRPTLLSRNSQARPSECRGARAEDTQSRKKRASARSHPSPGRLVPRAGPGRLARKQPERDHGLVGKLPLQGSLAVPVGQARPSECRGARAEDTQSRKKRASARSHPSPGRLVPRAGRGARPTRRLAAWLQVLGGCTGDCGPQGPAALPESSPSVTTASQARPSECRGARAEDTQSRKKRASARSHPSPGRLVPRAGRGARPTRRLAAWLQVLGGCTGDCGPQGPAALPESSPSVTTASQARPSECRGARAEDTQSRKKRASARSHPSPGRLVPRAGRGARPTRRLAAWLQVLGGCTGDCGPQGPAALPESSPSVTTASQARPSECRGARAEDTQSRKKRASARSHPSPGRLVPRAGRGARPTRRLAAWLQVLGGCTGDCGPQGPAALPESSPSVTTASQARPSECRGARAEDTQSRKKRASARSHPSPGRLVPRAGRGARPTRRLAAWLQVLGGCTGDCGPQGPAALPESSPSVTTASQARPSECRGARAEDTQSRKKRASARSHPSPGRLVPRAGRGARPTRRLAAWLQVLGGCTGDCGPQGPAALPESSPSVTTASQARPSECRGARAEDTQSRKKRASARSHPSPGRLVPRAGRGARPTRRLAAWLQVLGGCTGDCGPQGPAALPESSPSVTTASQARPSECRGARAEDTQSRKKRASARSHPSPGRLVPRAGRGARPTRRLAAWLQVLGGCTGDCGPQGPAALPESSPSVTTASQARPSECRGARAEDTQSRKKRASARSHPSPGRLVPRAGRGARPTRRLAAWLQVLGGCTGDCGPQGPAALPESSPSVTTASQARPSECRGARAEDTQSRKKRASARSHPSPGRLVPRAGRGARPTRRLAAWLQVLGGCTGDCGPQGPAALPESSPSVTTASQARPSECRGARAEDTQSRKKRASARSHPSPGRLVPRAGRGARPTRRLAAWLQVLGGCTGDCGPQGPAALPESSPSVTTASQARPSECRGARAEDTQSRKKRASARSHPSPGRLVPRAGRGARPTRRLAAWLQVLGGCTGDCGPQGPAALPESSPSVTTASPAPHPGPGAGRPTAPGGRPTLLSRNSQARPSECRGARAEDTQSRKKRASARSHPSPGRLVPRAGRGARPTRRLAAWLQVLGGCTGDCGPQGPAALPESSPSVTTASWGSCPSRGASRCLS
ncbi:collagen alpha-1(I) chain-like, partial [Manis pentadactyla]|uniref:collagen alpha-1(I) chain-like n=1 Tax=Manis pentadactyla TaxID=143292 RepID=UPI00255CBA17